MYRVACPSRSWIYKVGDSVNKPEVPQSQDARLPQALIIRGFISKIKLKCKKNTERLKFCDFNICPNILRVDNPTSTQGVKQ